MSHTCTNQSSDSLCRGAQEENKLFLRLLLLFNRPAPAEQPLLSLLHVGVGSSQSTWVVYTVGLMKRYSADFNTFLLGALFLEAESNSIQFSASVIAAAGHCDERKHDMEADPDNTPSSNHPLVRLRSVLSHLDRPRSSGVTSSVQPRQ